MLRYTLWALLLSFGTTFSQEQYNILWITVEDMSPRLGCYGDSTIATPNIDRLAQEGVRYTNAYGTYGVCAPNRHTLITGMYPTSTGAMAMRTSRRTSALDKITDPELLSIPVYEATPPAGVKCFTEFLRQKGYYCTNNSKTDYQFKTPITAWDESSKKAHWRNRPSKKTPFFAVFNSMETHESRTFKKYSPKVADPNRIEVPPYYPDTPTVRADMARHYDNIHSMDNWVGEILAQLKKDGLLDKTIIFFYSDHGDGLPRAKRWVYDSGIQVPLIIRWPDGSNAGTVNEDLVSFIDFAPTTLSLAGITSPKYIEGQVFAGKQKADPRKYIYAFRDRMDPAPETIRAVRDDRFEYVRNYRPDLPYLGYIPYRDQAAMMQEILKLKNKGKLGKDQWQFWAEKKPLEELYDTQIDPYQINNLASNPAHFQKLAVLRTAREEFVKKYGDLGMIPEKELIKKLWPPDGVQPVTEKPVLHYTDSNRLEFTSATEGASIAYKWQDENQWNLYSVPIQIKKGKSIQAVAIRIGWKPSTTVQLKCDGSKKDTPNIVVLIADDVSWNDLGCYGSTSVQTPNIDKLASGGMKFNNAILTASSCSPSRISIMTGRYPHNTGAAELHTEPKKDFESLASRLKSNGYYTGQAGKWHMGQLLRKGFDRIYDNGKQNGDGGEDMWIPSLKERDQNKPFFFWFASYDAHRPWGSNKFAKTIDLKDVEVPATLVDSDSTRLDLARYFIEIKRFDFHVGEVVKELKRQGVYDNTVIIVMADNGRPFPRDKTRMYDSGMKTPFIVHWPKTIKKGTVSKSLLSSVDIAPTLLDICSVPVPESFQGKSFEPALKDPGLEIRKYAFSEHNWHDYEAHERMARTENFIYILNSRPQFSNQGPADAVTSPSFRAMAAENVDQNLTPAQFDVFLAPRPAEELFYCKNDFLQLDNLIGNKKYTAVHRELKDVLKKWMDQTGDTVPENLTKDWYDRGNGEKIEANANIRGEMPGKGKRADTIYRRLKF